MSVFEPIPQDKSSDEVAYQIEGLVLEGILRTGEQLPGERELALQTGVSRPVLRDALERLVQNGILIRKQGGGTFVADIIGQVFTDPITELLGNHKKATVDYIEYRREIEGVAAGFAAERATKYDIDLLERHVEHMKQVHLEQNFELETKADIEFHSLIGEMSHNLVLLHTLRSCYKLLSEGVLQNRERLYETGGRQSLFDQHMEIADAIIKKDKEKSIEAARSHMSFVLEKYQQMAQQLERERVSNLRLMQRD